MTDVVNTTPDNAGTFDTAGSPPPHEHSRTGLSADGAVSCAARSAITSPTRSPAPLRALTSDHYYPRARARGARPGCSNDWMATTQDWLDLSNK